jgi:short-subunit dehydrogenase
MVAPLHVAHTWPTLPPVQIRDRVTLITGASTGIGAACARVFARADSRVVLFARSADRLAALAEEIRQAGGAALAVPGDITRRADITAAVQQAEATWGGVDILINNAGIGLYAPVAEVEEALFRRVWETNVMGALYAIQAVVPGMRRQGAGVIVNVSSIAGKRAMPHTAVYAATKFALNALSEGLRVELAPMGIQVLNVYPGLTKTSFQASALANLGMRKPPDRGVPAERVATVIRRAVERGRRDSYIQFYERVWVVVNMLAPGIGDWVATLLMRRRDARLGQPTATASDTKQKGYSLG